MGIIPGFALCEDICGRVERFFTRVHNHPIIRYILSGLLFINYYAQEGYKYIHTFGKELYYRHIDTNFETLYVTDEEEYGEEISTLYYSNHKTNKYVTLKSNSMTLKNFTQNNDIARNLINSVVHYKNPMLSAILSIKDNSTTNEYSLEVNNILEPFLFTGNTIHGTREFLLYLIHTYYKKHNPIETAENGCIALEDDTKLDDFSISLTYITLTDNGIMTIPEMTTSEWTMKLTDDNKVELIIEQKED